MSFEKNSGLDLINSLITRSVQVISSFDPSTIVQFLHGLSKLEIEGVRDFIPLFAAVAKQQLHLFSVRELTVLLHSLSMMGYEDYVDLIPACQKLLLTMADSFDKAQQFSNIVCSFARLDVPVDTVLLDMIVQQSALRLHSFFVSELAMLLWGLSRLKHHPGDNFMLEVDNYVARSYESMGLIDLSNILYASADFGSPMPHLLLSTKSIIGIHTFTSRSLSIFALATTAWSLAVMDKLEVDVFEWICTVLDSQREMMSNSMKRQFYQAFVYVRMTHEDSEYLEQKFEELYLSCKEEWRMIIYHTDIPSIIINVFFILKGMGYNCEAKVLGDYVISASTATDKEGRKIAVEVDHPIRHFRNEPERLMGRFFWREKVLRHEGWPVVRIRLSEWKTLNVESKTLYLAKKIEETLKTKNPKENPLCVASTNA